MRCGLFAGTCPLVRTSEAAASRIRFGRRLAELVCADVSGSAVRFLAGLSGAVRHRRVLGVRFAILALAALDQQLLRHRLRGSVLGYLLSCRPSSPACQRDIVFVVSTKQKSEQLCIAVCRLPCAVQSFRCSLKGIFVSG